MKSKNKLKQPVVTRCKQRSRLEVVADAVKRHPRGRLLRDLQRSLRDLGSCRPGEHDVQVHT